MMTIVLIVTTEPEPVEVERWGKISYVASSFCRPSVLLLCLAGSIRNAAGYVWAYNVQLYFENIGQTKTEIASWLSWIPMVGGSIGKLYYLFSYS